MTAGEKRRIETLAREQGIDDFKWIDPKKVVTGHWVRAKCLYGCARYGSKGCCPPEVPSVAECRSLFGEYGRGIFFHLPKKFADPQMRFAWSREINRKVLAFERGVFLEGFPKALVFTPAPCNICGECRPSKRECRHPSSARPTLEAYGVDVFTTARKFGYALRVLKNYGEETNRFGLLLVE